MKVTAAMTDMIRDSARATLDGISAIVNSDSYRAFKKSISDIALFLEEHRDELQAIANAPESARDLAPYLKLELDAAQDDPAFADLQLEELFERGFDVDGNLTDSPFRQIIERAQLLKADYETAAETIADIEQAAGELPRVKYKKITEIKSLTDKLAAVFFSLMAPESTPASIEGQRQMTPLRYESLKSKKEITLFYDYVYNEEVLEKYGINKKFDDYDFFVMTIIDTLYANGNNIVSFTKIFKEMGGEGNPTSKQLAPIYYSLLKGMTTIITINDEEVQRAWKTGTYHEILSPIIPVQIGNERFIASGKIANGYVRINGFSPFMQVAQPLGHLTAWNKDILRLYKGRKTKRYYSVMRFLMMQIGWMRNGERSRKILYSSLYKHTGDATTRARQLARDMMYDLLENVFKPTGYITGYKEDGAAAPGVELIIGKQKLIGAKPK